MFPTLPQCLSSERPLPCVLLAVELLSVLVDHDSLAQQLCSHSGKAGQGSLNCPRVGGKDWGQGQVQSPSRASLLVPQATMKRGSLSEICILFRRLPSPEAVHVYHIKA